MIRLNHTLMSTLTVLAGLSQAFAQEAMQASPITPGYWTWPREKNMTPQAIADECRVQFSVQFADGHYFTVKLRDGGKVLSPPQVSEAGLCSFSRETQIETCTMKFNSDGAASAATIESRFSSEGGVLRMNVTHAAGGRPEPPFDVYPVRCPEDRVWQNLLGE
jgi:hypothetical protein